MGFHPLTGHFHPKLGHPTAGAKIHGTRSSVFVNESQVIKNMLPVWVSMEMGGGSPKFIACPCFVSAIYGQNLSVFGCNMNNTQGSQLRQPVDHTQQPYAP